MNRGLIFSLIFILFCLGACVGQTTPTYETVAPAAISPGADIPTPVDETVLILTGAIAVKNEGDQLSFDMPTLEKVGLVKYTVADPWLNTEVTYTGVLLSDLLKVAQATETVSAVHVVALDDYAADIPISEIQEWPVLLATQADGQYIAIEHNGPTRIIFPYDSHPNITNARNMSVWNVKSLEIK